jgi:hypothetical protein
LELNLGSCAVMPYFRHGRFVMRPRSLSTEQRPHHETFRVVEPRLGAGPAQGEGRAEQKDSRALVNDILKLVHQSLFLLPRCVGRGCMGLELPLRATEADEARWHPGRKQEASSGKRREKVREVSPCCVVVV